MAWQDLLPHLLLPGSEVKKKTSRGEAGPDGRQLPCDALVLLDPAAPEVPGPQSPSQSSVGSAQIQPGTVAVECLSCACINKALGRQELLWQPRAQPSWAASCSLLWGSGESTSGKPLREAVAPPWRTAAAHEPGAGWSPVQAALLWAVPSRILGL